MQFTVCTNFVVLYQHSTVGPYADWCPYHCSISIKRINVRNMNFYTLQLHNYKNKRFREYKNPFFFYIYIRINPVTLIYDNQSRLILYSIYLYRRHIIIISFYLFNFFFKLILKQYKIRYEIDIRCPNYLPHEIPF